MAISEGEADPLVLHWNVYLTAMAWVEECPERYRRWAWDDADAALRIYLEAVDRALFRARPDLIFRPWLI